MTRLRRSIFFCSERYNGAAHPITRPSTRTITGMMTAKSSDRRASCRRAMMTPPRTMMGAKTIRERATFTIVWTCWASLVLRVIKDGAPNRSSSPWEKPSTFRKRAPRTSRPKSMAVLAPR